MGIAVEVVESWISDTDISNIWKKELSAFAHKLAVEWERHAPWLQVFSLRKLKSRFSELWEPVIDYAFVLM